MCLKYLFFGPTTGGKINKSWGAEVIVASMTVAILAQGVLVASHRAFGRAGVSNSP